MSGERPVRTRRRRTLAAVAVTVAAMATGLAGCAPADDTQTGGPSPSDRVNSGIVESDAPPTLGGSIAYGLSAETNGWNPAINQWGPSGWLVARTIFDNLASYDSDGVARPDAASSFEHNEDYTVWTVNLRPGMEYHDGEPVDADSVARTQEQFRLSPVTAPGYKWIETIEAVGTDKVVFTMAKPWANFPTILATQIGVVAEPDWMKSNDALQPIGSGPFTLVSWAVGSELVVQKNAKYWRSDTRGNKYPYLDSVKFRVMNDGSSRASALQTGDVDIAEVTEPTIIRRFRESGEDYQLFTNSNSEMTEVFVQLNTQKAPFDDVDARRALAYATDQQAIVDTVEAGVFETATGPFAKSSRYYDPDNGYPAYDPAKARELVEAVKGRNGGTFSFTIEGSANGDTMTTLQLLQQMYQEVGMDVKVNSVEQATTAIDAVVGNYQAMVFGGWWYEHPDSEVAFIDPRNGVPPPEFTLNLTRNNDPELATMIDSWRAATDPTAQKQGLDQIVRRINEKVPYIWLFHSQNAVVASRHLVNITDYTLPDGEKGLDMREGSHPLFQVWLQR